MILAKVRNNSTAALDIKLIALDLLAFPFYAIGWMTGSIVWLARFWFAALRLGVEDGQHGSSN